MVYRFLQPAWRHLTLLMVMVSLCGLARPSLAKDTLTWLMRDLPPSTIYSGPLEGKGAVDRLMPLLIARMPQYDHVLMRVNRARGMQMLQNGSFTCDPTLLWTAERARTIAFSIPIYAIPSNGLVIRRAQRALFTPFITEGQLDLPALLESKTVRIGIVAERSYGPDADQALQLAPPESLSGHFGNDAIGSMLQMERLGRLQGLISYWPEARYLAQEQGIDPADLDFLPIGHMPKYQFGHIGCANTEQGREAIEVINREMRVLRRSDLIGFYAEWLDPKMRLDYIEDAKVFFEDR